MVAAVFQRGFLVFSFRLNARKLVGVIFLCAVSAPIAAAGELEDRAIEVRAFIDSVVGGIETLQIPEDIHDLPQPTLEGGEIDPLYEITEAKAELGMLLFHDPLFSAGSVFEETRFTASCASCHFHEAGFRAGQVDSLGVGARGFLDDDGQARRVPIPSFMKEDVGPTPEEFFDTVDNPAIVSPSINMVAFFDELNWNGAAFLTGEGELPAVERQVRIAFEAHRMLETEFRAVNAYIPYFEAAYPELAGEPVEVLMGQFEVFRAIGAYERTVVSNHSRWDAFLVGDNVTLTFQELDGAELYFGDANCVACHGGPALGSTAYYALGVAEHPALQGGDQDFGRFNVTRHPDDMYKFRAMTVRNLKGAGPFFHGGSAQTVEDVIRYKNAGVPDQAVSTLSPLFVPLGLSEDEVLALTAFVADALHDPDMNRFTPTELPSGLCIPHDDTVSRYDAECDVYGDFDGDGDADLVDFALLQICFGGDANVTDGACVIFDRDGDEQVDLADFSQFHDNVTGPG